LLYEIKTILGKNKPKPDDKAIYSTSSQHVQKRVLFKFCKWQAHTAVA